MSPLSTKVSVDKTVSMDYPFDPVDQWPSNFSYNSSNEGQDYDYDIDESYSRYLSIKSNKMSFQFL